MTLLALPATGLAVLVGIMADSSSIPAWMVFLTSGGTLGLMGLLFRFMMRKTEQRLGEAGASKTEAEATEIQDRVRKALMDEVEVKMQATRREAEHARTQQAVAEKELAEASAEVSRMVLEHQRDREAWREERHQLVNKNRDELNAKDIKIAALERHVEVLQEKVRVLEIAAGYAEGRREEDTRTQGRMSALEDRADRSEQKADIAKQVADRQGKRNDDTEGHA